MNHFLAIIRLLDGLRVCGPPIAMADYPQNNHKMQRGMFGRIEVEVFAFYDGEAAFGVKYAINPSGWRNLRFDLAAQPKPALYG